VPTYLSPCLAEAFALALDVHAKQPAKGPDDLPALAHLLAVCSIVLAHHGDEDQAIAALLHDAVEDGGGLAVLERIRAAFGDRVAGIVEACSDSLAQDPSDKDAWRPRKQRYLAHLPTAPVDALLVSLADKVHNSARMIDDYRQVGETLWDRFKDPDGPPGDKERAEPARRSAKRTAQLWYYRSLVDIYRARAGEVPAALPEQLARNVEELEAISSP
jgi:GTP pyrophosphokinase